MFRKAATDTKKLLSLKDDKCPTYNKHYLKTLWNSVISHKEIDKILTKSISKSLRNCCKQHLAFIWSIDFIYIIQNYNWFCYFKIKLMRNSNISMQSVPKISGNSFMRNKNRFITIVVSTGYCLTIFYINELIFDTSIYYLNYLRSKTYS